VILTALSEAEIRTFNEEAQEMGVDEFIRKPLMPDVVHSLVAKLQRQGVSPKRRRSRRRVARHPEELPKTQGILFDQPRVVAGVAREKGNKTTVLDGDFFVHRMPSSRPDRGSRKKVEHPLKSHR